jgi:ABC-type transport system substrate-binding protein
MRAKVVPPESLPAGGDLTQGPIVGTGSWIYDGQWVPQQKLNMSRNPSFFKEGLPYADGYQRIVIKDPQTRQAAFRTGQIHFIATNGQITQLMKQTVPDLQIQDSKLVQVLSFNAILSSPITGPTRDPRVRQAVSKILDRDAVIRNILFGSAYISDGIFVPAVDWHLSESEIQQSLGRDVQKAKELLSAAGVDLRDWKPRLDFGASTGSDDWAQVAELFVSNLKEVGIDVSGVVLQDKVSITEKQWQRAELEISLANHRPGSGGSNGVLYTWFHTSGGDAGVFKQLNDKRLDDLIDQQAVIVNEPERRKGLLQEIMRLNLELAVLSPVYISNGEEAIAPNVRGFKAIPQEPQRWANVWYAS